MELFISDHKREIKPNEKDEKKREKKHREFDAIQKPFILNSMQTVHIQWLH